MHLRKIAVEDATLVRTLRLLGLQESPTAFGSSYEEELERPLEFTANRIAENLARGDFIIGAFDNEKLVGVAGFVGQRALKTKHIGFIWGMYVHPGYRGKGIGRKIIEQVIDHVRDRGDIMQIKLTVNSENIAAKTLYESLGFKTYGVEPKALQVDGVYYDEDLMMLWLD